jgi:hypothetical protein
MHKNGLPPCKVVLKDKPSHDDSHKPIHYVAASEDLQVCFIHVFSFLYFLFLYSCVLIYLHFDTDTDTERLDSNFRNRYSD